MTYTAKPALERFMRKVDKQDCWLWTGGLTHDGYGRFYRGLIDGVNRFTIASRFAYEALVGPIPDGLQVDHLCRVRRCVNPAHLRLLTGRENKLAGDTINARNAAKTHCPKNHPYDAVNTYLTPDGRRDCRTCRSEAGRRSRARRAVA